MAMTWVWAAMLLVSVAFGAINGSTAEVAKAAINGSAEAVKLCLSIGGAICLWSGVMEVMKRSKLSKKLARLLSPVLKLLFKSANDSNVLQALAENVSANMLGLGNAATPAGIRAAGAMKRLGAADDLCMLVVLNTASIQLIPATTAAVRAAAGAENAFDILPAVWLSSVLSAAVGIVFAKFSAKARKRGEI